MHMNNKATFTLLITCPDRKGLVAGISEFLYLHGANIVMPTSIRTACCF